MRVLLAMAVAAAVVPAGAQVVPSTPVQATLMAPGLRVADLARSMRFYTAALGLVPTTTLRHPGVTETMLCTDTAQGRLALILLSDPAPGKSIPVTLGDGFAKIVMRVADVPAVAARVKAAGYPVGEPHGGGRGPMVLMVRDPDGYTLELVGPTPHA